MTEKMKKYLALVIILILLVVIAFLLELPRRGAGPASTTLFSIDPAAPASIGISRDASMLTLRKRASGWTVSAGGAEYPADTLRLASILELMAGMEGDVVSVNPDNHSIFGVAETGGTLVTVWDETDSVLASFILGKPSKDFLSTYLREASSQDVYAVPGFLSSDFRADADFYRRRSLLNFAEADIETLRLIYPEKSLVFARDTLGGMALEEPGDASFNSTRLKQAISSLSRLNATAFADSADEGDAGLQSPRLAVVVTLRNGESFRLNVGDLEEMSYYVAMEGDPVIYLVNKRTTETFYKTYETYLGR